MGDDEVAAGGEAGGGGEGEGDAICEFPIAEVHRGVASIMQLDELQRQWPEERIVRRVVVDFIDHRSGVHQGGGGESLRSRSPRGAAAIDGAAAEVVGGIRGEAGDEAGEISRIEPHGSGVRP